MSESKLSAEIIAFLEKHLETIINKNLNFTEIINYSRKENQDKKIKGLNNEKIRVFLKRNGFEKDDASNKWVKSSQIKIVDSANPPVKKSMMCNDKPTNNKKQIEELYEKINNHELIHEKIIERIMQIQNELSSRLETSYSKYPSDNPLNFPEFIESSYSSSKRYEITLSEDLVNKATEKLKNKYNFKAADLTKQSNLFEIILFDYLNSIK